MIDLEAIRKRGAKTLVTLGDLGNVIALNAGQELELEIVTAGQLTTITAKNQDFFIYRTAFGPQGSMTVRISNIEESDDRS